MTVADDQGMILLNVLAIVAVSSAVVMMMIASQDVGLARTQRLREAAQAAAFARSGELSAVVALRRDAVSAPQSDHYGEAWAKVRQEDTTIAGGRFSLAIEDAQAKFNINTLVTGGLAAEAQFRKLASRVRPADGTADRVIGLLRATGPIADLSAMASAGVDQDSIARLETLATALPGATTVNLNTADETLLATLLDNPVSANVLIARRQRAGFLTPDDLKAAQVVAPPGLGFTSDLYRVQTVVTIGETRQSLTSLLARKRRAGVVEVVAVARQRGTAAPVGAPPL